MKEGGGGDALISHVLTSRVTAQFMIKHFADEILSKKGPLCHLFCPALQDVHFGGYRQKITTLVSDHGLLAQVQLEKVKGEQKSNLIRNNSYYSYMSSFIFLKTK